MIRKGFTLIELMVVIAIIAILAGLLMPAIGAAMNKAHETSSSNTIHQCQIFATNYINDHGDFPPSTWRDFFHVNPFKRIDAATGHDVLDIVPLGGDGVVDDNDYRQFRQDTFGVPFATNPVDLPIANEGNEVFVACLASQDGGPYMQAGEKQLVDSGIAALLIQTDTNWYFKGANLLKLVDWWGNPFVYIHNRNYAMTDGDPANDGHAWASVTYTGRDGEIIWALSRFSNGFKTNTAPNLDSYQMYSFGSDELEHLVAQPGPPPVYTVPPGWTRSQMHFLANWEE